MHGARRRSLPFPDNSVSYIYSSHLFEHFTFPDPMTSILAECVRVLKPYGVFDICVPNARPYIEAYCSGKDEYPHPLELLMTPVIASHTNGRIDMINYIAYMGGIHRYMFDEENLVSLLRRAGLKGVHLREFNWAYDIGGREHESIYAMGVKPE
jgi:predicted SAM-dependent methyltransferase